MPKPTNEPTPTDGNKNGNQQTPPTDGNGDDGNTGGVNSPQGNDTTPPDKHGEPSINKGRYNRNMHVDLAR